MLFVSHAERSFDSEGRLHDRDVAAALRGIPGSLRSWIKLHRRSPGAQPAVLGAPGE
jgi:hypothetical protein